MLKAYCDICGGEADSQRKATYIEIDYKRSMRVEFFMNRGSEAVHTCANCRIIQTADALRVMLPNHLKDEKIFDAAKKLQEELATAPEPSSKLPLPFVPSGPVACSQEPG